MLPCTVSYPWSWVGRGFLTLLLSLEQMSFSRAFQFLPGRSSVCGIVESTHTFKRTKTSSQWACSEHYDWLLDLSLPYCPSCFLGNWLTQKESIWSSKRALSPPFLSCQNKVKTVKCHTPSCPLQHHLVKITNTFNRFLPESYRASGSLP